MCAIDDAEPATLWNEHHPVARKRWICDECVRPIPPGERYRRVKSLSDGRWWMYRECQHCEAAGVWLNTVCGGYLTHGLQEEMREHWDEGYCSVGFGRLIVGMRRRWRDGADPVPDPAAVRALAEQMMAKAVA